MRTLTRQAAASRPPESLAEQLQGEPGVMVLRSALFDSPQAHYSYVVARPFLTFRSFGSLCELGYSGKTHLQFGNPWNILNSLTARYELLDEVDLPFPLGGCFGYWGYELKHFIEPKLQRRAINDLELPECNVGFYDSLAVFDHRLQKTWIVSTGLQLDGSRDESHARRQLDFWFELLECDKNTSAGSDPNLRAKDDSLAPDTRRLEPRTGDKLQMTCNLSKSDFVSIVQRAQHYIRSGDIYQVNLSQRLAVPRLQTGLQLFQSLLEVSPAPFAGYLDCGQFQVVSSSPELFLRMSGRHIQTRPIKGTRPRSDDAIRDAQLSYELQTSQKEMAELVMITDLLRNDLGRVCEFGSVQVPELARLERYPQVQHLVSTVEGMLRPDCAHLQALAQCFPGGSVTGAPKFRAMDIIEELEPITRGPYTGCLGYLGFNRESQLSIIIRTAVCLPKTVFFNVGAGIVADSAPVAEYEETLAKAQGFIAALELPNSDFLISRQIQS